MRHQIQIIAALAAGMLAISLTACRSPRPQIIRPTAAKTGDGLQWRQVNGVWWLTLQHREEKP